MDGMTFPVGAYEVTAIFDGTLKSGLDKIPLEEDRRAAETMLAQAPPDAMIMEVYAFLIRGPGGPILIDAGTGVLKGPQTGHLWKNLPATGVAFDDIRRIYLTHLHGDHFGGLIDEAGVPVFRNAELVVSEPEMRFWFDTPTENMPARARNAVSDARRVMSPYLNRLRRIPANGAYEGLTAVSAPGHTPGHTCWLLASQGISLLAWGDVVHISALHIQRPRTGMEYDLDIALAGETRVRILDLAAREGFVVAGAHLKAPPFARIFSIGDGYEARPA